MIAKISLLVICVEAIIYLLLHNLYDCTFKYFKFCYGEMDFTEHVFYKIILL